MSDATTFPKNHFIAEPVLKEIVQFSYLGKWVIGKPKLAEFVGLLPPTEN